jgi:hypothetical protein
VVRRKIPKSKLNSGMLAAILFRNFCLPNLSKNFKTKICEAITLPAVFYGSESWSLTLREGHKLRMFENRVLRGIFEPKREEVTGGCRELNNEQLHNLYASPNIIRVAKLRRMRVAGRVARLEEMRNTYRMFVGIREGKRPLGRHRSRWEDNIGKDFREIGWGSFVLKASGSG